MNTIARLYHCARCHCQVLICSHCDRGNIYCYQGCAKTARQHSLQAASERYQQTYQGRLKHAQRQKRYRAAQAEKSEENIQEKAQTIRVKKMPEKEKVTHQGSLDCESTSPLVTPEKSVEPGGSLNTCHFCGRSVGEFMRLETLKGSALLSFINHSTCAQGP